MAAFLNIRGYGKGSDTVTLHKATLNYIIWVLQKRGYVSSNCDLSEVFKPGEVGLDISVHELDEEAYNAFYQLMLLGYDDAKNLVLASTDDKQRKARNIHLESWGYLLERIRADKRFHE